MIKFDGKKIRDEILSDLKKKVAILADKPILAIISIGNNSVSEKYIEAKKKACKFVGVGVEIIRFPDSVGQSEVEQALKTIQAEGIFIQMPMPKPLDREALIKLIPADKDVDGLRFCLGEKSNFLPPVVLAILKAIELSGADIKKSKIAIIGRGFLVGKPLSRVLVEAGCNFQVVNSKTPDIKKITLAADLIISASGRPGIIKSSMIKNGAVLIDAGTTEVGGALVGDINPKVYEKSAFYTPVPGGIGPLTVAMLLTNLLETKKSS